MSTLRTKGSISTVLRADAPSVQQALPIEREPDQAGCRKIGVDIG
jgi:hypothetical protein